MSGSIETVSNCTSTVTSGETAIEFSEIKFEFVDPLNTEGNPNMAALTSYENCRTMEIESHDHSLTSVLNIKTEEPDEDQLKYTTSNDFLIKQEDIKTEYPELEEFDIKTDILEGIERPIKKEDLD